MSDKISRQQVVQLASLAKLDLSEEELESYRRELELIVEFVGQLQAADVGGLAATEQVTGLEDVVREDAARPDISLGLGEMAQNAELEDRQFKVPKVNL